MVGAAWTLLWIYAGSILLLVLTRLASRFSRAVRLFLVGEQADDGWQQREAASWRRGR